MAYENIFILLFNMNQIKKFPIYRQLDIMDCGPTCLRMIAQFFGKHYSMETLRSHTYINRDGVSIKGLSDAAIKLGFQVTNVKMTFEQLDEIATLPCILHWKNKHFVVLPPQNYNRNKKNNQIIIIDPAYGQVRVSHNDFLKYWIASADDTGLALLFEPTDLFYELKEEDKPIGTNLILYKYLKPYKRYLLLLFLGMIIGSMLSLITPFLTQSIVDYGINQKDIGFIYLILISQLILFLGSVVIGIVRSWLLLHMSARINISIISDFLIKLMKLPINFFDTKKVGDILQRVHDHNRIEQFISTTSLNTLFSIINLFVFAVVLFIYSIPVLIIFTVGSFLSIAWIYFSLKKRKELDYARFQRLGDNQNLISEMVTGMQEIKMNNSETNQLVAWQKVQLALFKLNIKGLALEQYQSIGAAFFSQLKNILISFVSAKEVVNGNISLGMMLSISYICGQMNSPIDQILVFFRYGQDAKLSIERLREIYNRANEDLLDKLEPDYEFQNNTSDSAADGISLENVSFRYSENPSAKVLSDVTVSIPLHKTTAIVGDSGSGKTTLIKLLLKFYDPIGGNINLNSTPLNSISPKWWRSKCGVVMADGYIFSNSIAHNITLNEVVDNERLLFAIKISGLEEFIDELPLGLSSKIGNTGNGISSGQKQRILLARAIYKDPEFIFLDEATSMLDANSEKNIIQNIHHFFSKKTIIIIAHRLSTIRYADKIIVMHKGKVVEVGSHDTLLSAQGKYYELVKNQFNLKG